MRLQKCTTLKINQVKVMCFDKCNIHNRQKVSNKPKVNVPNDNVAGFQHVLIFLAKSLIVVEFEFTKCLNFSSLETGEVYQSALIF